MMFGGGLALAAGIGASGLADWLGEALEPLAGVHPLIIAAAVTALVILITEFASNVAAASGVMPVVAGLIAATGSDPWLLAMCRLDRSKLGLHDAVGDRPQCTGLGDRSCRASQNAACWPDDRFVRDTTDRGGGLAGCRFALIKANIVSIETNIAIGSRQRRFDA
jgi:hypothetical protein